MSTTVRGYRSFTELRREMRGSASWTNHIDEIADAVGRVEDRDDHKHALFDNYEDFDEDDE
ncbi:MAG: hypothetical protein IT381_25740 [Deltaproteobacteria bacterium]|nr:hypothetical protein [Deltaproteobacteria bacterium]